ncbi:hypothetical protein FEM48_Zijuj04G0123200 [Ziziphus jujuba var. spinosa]|uniref:SAM-dependent MTase DRM-type domain-containing protein n=1 Tax=Ziziphus jujuba var. spinosa TaxID=714518 RepID=A0A978VJU7_ZIZJJ|nr:hypothetical protein FEM48_Zijuj04G0123200 [Ziziphus jujuba var. spinosa]
MNLCFTHTRKLHRGSGVQYAPQLYGVVLDLSLIVLRLRSELRSGSKSSSDKACEKLIIPNEEILDYEIPLDTFLSRNFEDNGASSSGSNLRSSFLGMGFRPSLVDKVIEEKGEDDVDLILETLFAYSAPQKSNSESSDSPDSLFDDNGISSPLEIATLIQPKEEPEIASEIDDGKRASLLMMNFSVNEVEFSIDKLSEDAPVDELVDFIVAAQMAERFEKDTDDTSRNDEEKNEMWKLLVDYETGHWNSLMISAILAHLRFKNSNSLSGGQYIVEMSIMQLGRIFDSQDLNNETLFGTMDKTVCLLEMGFSENQQYPLSSVCLNFSSEAPILELADPIFKGRIPDKCRGKDKYHSTAANINHSQTRKGCNPDSMGRNPSYHSTAAHINHSQTRKGCKDDSMGMQDVLRNPSYDVKTENEDLSVDAPQSVDMNLEEAYLGKRPKEEYIGDYSGAVPQFMHINHEENRKGKRPKQEYVDYSTSFLDPTWDGRKKRLILVSPQLEWLMEILARMVIECRKNRFYVIPKPPMTIEDAIPQTKKWWPPWDMTKQLSHINSETTGICQLCDRVGRMLAELRGQLSLGSLRYCLQTDVLGYLLSVLKSLYPGGLTLLSIFSGIGGAEIALHRLGIRMRDVVSVETSGMKRRILKRWWQNTGQSGELLQIEDIQRLTSSKLESLFGKFGGFELIICQNPCTGDSVPA